jgi:hypothetical protein
MSRKSPETKIEPGVWREAVANKWAETTSFAFQRTEDPCNERRQVQCLTSGDVDHVLATNQVQIAYARNVSI